MCASHCATPQSQGTKIWRHGILFICHIISDSLGLHGLHHSRPPYPSPSPGTCSNYCRSSWWCHPTVSSSVILFSRLQSFPASGSFQMSQFFASGGQSIAVSALASVFPMNIQDWFPLGWTVWISLQSRSLLQHNSSKVSIIWHSAFFMVQLLHLYVMAGKTIVLIIRTFVSKVVSLLFNTLSRSVIAFLPRSNCFLMLCNTSTINGPTLMSSCVICGDQYKMNEWAPC